MTTAAHPKLFTVQDCTLNGASIALAEWPRLHSEEIARVVGPQQPGEALEDASDFTWEACWVALSDLHHATQDGDLPEDGWSSMYQRQLDSDRQAAANGSPEYAGRDAWIQHVWLRDSRVYPIYLVKEFDGDSSRPPRLRLLDGHHRLAGAFQYRADQVFALVGTPKS